MRRVYVYRNGEMVPKEEATPIDRGPIVCGDIPDFVSTVDGRVIHGRAGLRRHNKELGVTFTDDYKQTWADFQRRRERIMSGDDPRRVHAVARAFNHLEEQNRRRRSR
jgi:hypothetical protein